MLTGNFLKWQLGVRLAYIQVGGGADGTATTSSSLITSKSTPRWTGSANPMSSSWKSRLGRLPDLLLLSLCVRTNSGTLHQSPVKCHGTFFFADGTFSLWLTRSALCATIAIPSLRSLQVPSRAPVSPQGDKAQMSAIMCGHFAFFCAPQSPPAGRALGRDEKLRCAGIRGAFAARCGGRLLRRRDRRKGCSRAFRKRIARASDRG